uniref:Uncharacterized protein n=1 Tax=Opuntia streptacantha TaxID=393608 RepID=A0A7C9ALK8_OPUST
MMVFSSSVILTKKRKMWPLEEMVKLIYWMIENVLVILLSLSIAKCQMTLSMALLMGMATLQVTFWRGTVVLMIRTWLMVQEPIIWLSPVSLVRRKFLICE